jgi:hypothetical protein
MAELQADPAYVAREARRSADLERRAAAWRRAEAPLVEQLRAAGLDIASVWDLVNTSTPYPAAVPVLLEHLARPYPDRVREGIARALAVRDAAPEWETLARHYRDEPAGTDAKDGLAVALAASARDDVIDEIIALAKDGAHGDSRVLLLDALKRSKAPQARPALDELAADPVLGSEARRLLGRKR